MTIREAISVGTTANDGTGDTRRSGGQKTNRNLARLFFWAGGDSGALTPYISFDSDAMVFEGTSVDSFETRFRAINPTADRSIYLPDRSGTLLLRDDSATLSNKDLISPVLTTPQIDDSDGSFQYIITSAGGLAADRTVTLPILTGNDTIVFESHTQTLANKTLDSATVNDPTLTGTITDANGADLIDLTATASSVNYFTLANAATAGRPLLGVTGTDSDVSFDITLKGGGSLRVQKGAYRSTTVSTSGGVPKNRSYVLFNSGTALAMALQDGTTIGEFKIFTNRGAGTVTITPTNFAQGTDFELAQNEGAQVIWDGNNWFLIGNQSVVTIN